MSGPLRFEDGTTGRPLGDDEDLDPRAYADVPEREVDLPDAYDLRDVPGDWLFTRDERRPG